MAHNVFISYASRDKILAIEVCTALGKAGVCCWMAPRDVIRGMPRLQAVNAAIERSELVVVVFTARANVSTTVQRELALADRLGVPRLAFRVEDVPPASQYAAYSIQWLDAFTSPVESRLPELVETVRKLLPAPTSEGHNQTEIFPDIIAYSGGHGYHFPVEHSPNASTPILARKDNVVRRYGRIEYYSPMDKDLEYRLRVGFMIVRHARKILEHARIHWKNFEFSVAEDEPIIRVIPGSSYFYISPAFRDVKVLKDQDVFSDFKIMPHHIPDSAGNTCGLNIDFEYKGVVIYTLDLDVKVQCPFRFGPIQIAHQHWSRVGVLGGFIAAFDTAASLFSFMSPTHSIEESTLFIFIFLAAMALLSLSLHLRQRSGKRTQKEF